MRNQKCNFYYVLLWHSIWRNRWNIAGNTLFFSKLSLKRKSRNRNGQVPPSLLMIISTRTWNWKSFLLPKWTGVHCVYWKCKKKSMLVSVFVCLSISCDRLFHFVLILWYSLCLLTLSTHNHPPHLRIHFSFPGDSFTPEFLLQDRLPYQQCPI